VPCDLMKRVLAFFAFLPHVVARTQTFEAASLFDLYEHGLLPEVEVAGMRLKSVHIAHKVSRGPKEGFMRQKKPSWRWTKTRVPEDFQSRYFDEMSPAHALRGRLLSSVPRSNILKEAASAPFAFRTPRDKVRSVTALLAASIPLAEYQNVTFNYAQFKEVYDKGDSFFINWCENSSIANNASECIESVNASFGANLVSMEATALTESRTELRTAAGTAWIRDGFIGARSAGCAQTGQIGERCFGDEGVAMSTYEDTDSIILVLQAGLGTSDLANLIWQNKAWLLEQFEDSLREQWLISAQQAASTNITWRKADQAYEFPIRCAFLNEAYSPFVDAETVSVGSGIAQSYLDTEGLWPLIKNLVRTVLAEGQQFVKTLYLAGMGLGGSHAALASMWLKKNEDKVYDTYVIAAPGFQCTAKNLYSKDMMHYDTHSQIKVYLHVMDVLAGSVDQYSGTVCKYGLHNFTASESFYESCGRIVGHTGPELFWRPSTTSTTTTLELATDEQLAAQQELEQYNQNITEAKAAFDECIFFTHSIWYALLLFVNEDTLNLDGSTDGGCQTVDPIDQEDKYGRCPTTDTATTDCSSFFEPQAQVSMQMLGMIVGITGGVILCCAILGIAAVRHIQKNAMDDVSMSADHGPPSNGCMARLLRNCGIYVGAGKRDRAKEARIRAKKARDKRKNRNQEKTTLLEDGTEATPTPGVMVPSSTVVGKQGDTESLPPDSTIGEEPEVEEKKAKKEKKEKKEKKQKKDKSDPSAAGEPVDAISVRVLDEGEARLPEASGDDLLGSALQEQKPKKKNKKTNDRDTE